MAQELKQREVLDGIALVTGVAHELKLRTRLVGARLPGEFRRFRSFPGPNTLRMAKKILDDLAAKPDAETVVVGHSDQFGSSASNNRIAKSRAEATVALLTGNAAFFETQFKVGDEQSIWGACEADEMLEAIDAANGFPSTGASLLQDFKSKNGLGPDNELDAATIAKICEQYLALLGPRQLNPSQFHAVGAGTEQPVLGIAGGQPGSDDPDSPDFRDRRRVEVFVFENLILPSIASFTENSAQLEPTYKIWCNLCESTFSVAPEPLTVRVRDENGQALVGRQVQLLDLADPNSDTLSLVASANTDSTGVVRFAGQQGIFIVHLPNSLFDDELLVQARTDRVNRFYMSVLDSGPGF